jgi:hypothetical protein
MSTAEQEKVAHSENLSAMGPSPAAAARLQARTIPGVALLIGGLLVAGVTGTAVHRGSHHLTSVGSLSSDRAAIGMPAASPAAAAAAVASAATTVAGPTSSAAPTRAAPGDIVLTDQADGLSLSVPAGWRALPIDANGLGAAVKGLVASNPQLGTLLSQPQGYAATGYLRLLAVRTGSQPMVVALITTPAPAGVTLDQLAQSSLGAQNTSPGVNVQRVTLPAGPALQVSLKVPFNGQQLVLTQDLLMHNGKEVVVQVGSVTAAPTDAVLNQVLGSLRLH